MGKNRVLIVDDDANIRRLIRTILSQEEGLEIEEATNGLEAEEKVKTFGPDLIVLDVQMPEEGGYETCLHIRDSLDKRAVKIVGMSGVSGKIGDSIMTALGADYYFEKPFDNECFRRKVLELLNEA